MNRELISLLRDLEHDFSIMEWDLEQIRDGGDIDEALEDLETLYAKLKMIFENKNIKREINIGDLKEVEIE